MAHRSKKHIFKRSLWTRANPTRLPIIILGLDPGVRNFGWNVVRISGVNTSGTEVYESLCSGTLASSKYVKDNLNQDAQSSIRDLLGEISHIITPYNCYSIAIERFSMRNEGFAGDIEYLNVMIGSILGTSSVPVDLFMASTWKPVMLGTDPSRTLAAKSKAMFPKSTVVHETDAGCIALYGFRRLIKRNLIITDSDSSLPKSTDKPEGEQG